MHLRCFICFLVSGADVQVSVFYSLHYWGFQGLHLAMLFHEKCLMFPEEVCVLSTTWSLCSQCNTLWWDVVAIALLACEFLVPPSCKQKLPATLLFLECLPSLCQALPWQVGKRMGGEGWFMHLLVCSFQWFQPQQITYTGNLLLHFCNLLSEDFMAR